MPEQRHKMIADAKFTHEGKVLRHGDAFETDEANARDLIAIGMAHMAPGVVDAAVDAVRRTYRRRDMTAQ